MKSFTYNSVSMETNKSAEERIIEKALLKINKYHYAYRQDIVNAINEAMESYHQEQLRKIKKEIETEKTVIHFYTAKENEVKDDAYNSVIEIIDKHLK